MRLSASIDCSAFKSRCLIAEERARSTDSMSASGRRAADTGERKAAKYKRATCCGNHALTGRMLRG
jgi:hypothetical protein